MWDSILKLQEGLQYLRPLKVEYSQNMHTFHENYSRREKLVSYFVDLNVLLIWIASLVGLSLALSSPSADKETPTESTDNSNGTSSLKAILKSVLQALYLALFSLALAGAWTFKYRSKAAVWIMNQAKYLYEKRELNKNQATHQKEHIIFEVIAKMVVLITRFGVATVTATPFFSKSTPAHLILSPLLTNESYFHWIAILNSIICSMYLFIVALPTSVLIAQVMLYTVAILFECQFMLRSEYISRKEKAPRPSIGFLRAVTVYQGCTLFVMEFNRFGVAFFPLVMFIGMIINVMTTFVCIKFHSKIPALLFLVFAGFDICTIIVTIGLNAFAVIVVEERRRFFQFWRTRLKTLLHRKQYKAFYPIETKIGPFFSIQRTTLLNTFNQICGLTVSLLLLGD